MKTAERKELEYTIIIRRLIGSIDPIGKSEVDSDRLENLKDQCDLVSDLIREINYVSRSKDSYEGSVKNAGLFAEKFIKELIEEYGEFANQDKWISVEKGLPECANIMGCGNKYSDDFLVTDGKDCYVANLEAIRPSFDKKYWNITQSDQLVKDFSGKDVTHWQPLPVLPNPPKQ